MKKCMRVSKVMALVLSVCLAIGSGSVPAAAEQSAQPQTAITGLTTEYLTNPVGIDGDSVHFAWKMRSGRIGAKQTAYQVVVKQGETVVWDSGKVEDDRSTGIVCGAALEEGVQYQWTVTVWDETGTSYSESAVFETGVTNQEEWKNAAFIRLNSSQAAPIFRTEQALQDKEVEKARLYITALGAYEAYVNGNRVGEYNEHGGIVYHHMNPGYGNRAVSQGYQTYDVTSFLAEDSKAAVSVLAGNGWISGMATTVSQPAVKALLRVTYRDGSVQNIATNTTDWKGTLRGGITGNGVYYGEDYNAVFAEELGDFTQVGYDDSDWVNAQPKSAGEQKVSVIHNTFAPVEASWVRLLVKEAGPADNNRENLLQIMELELLDKDGNNVAKGVSPDISNTWSPNGQWGASHLTDGDYGWDSDKGYTSTVLGNGQTAFALDTPVSITLNLGKAVTLENMNLYPRTKVTSIAGYECANYPKTYALMVSADVQNWKTVDLSGSQKEAEPAEDTNWTEAVAARAYTVSEMRNYLLHPEVHEFYIGNEFTDRLAAKHVRISVLETGPAVAEDNENRLQIMELELLDGEENVVSGITPQVSDHTLDAVAQWNAKNLTDGNYGVSNDAGYSTDILGRGEQFMSLSEPITIQFDFDQEIRFDQLKFYPRAEKESISYGLCANYPKVYTVEISDDGQNWETVLDQFDQGMVRNETLYQNMIMSETAYAGTIRAQNAIPGKFASAYDREAVSAYTYTSATGATEQYPAGEVMIEDSYEATASQSVFGEGIELKKGQKLIVNMGQNISAVPNITFSGREGTRAVLNFAEMLNDGSAAGNGATQADGPKGSLYQKSLRGARSSVSYVFAGMGKETYQPAMSYFGYQYVQIMASDTITVYGLTSKALSSVTKQTGTITTNNEHVNQLFSNVIHGQLSNYFTTPTDCNQRDERLSWSGDTQAFAQTAVYNFDSAAFLNEMQDIYNENTFLKGYVPGVADDLDGFFQPWAAGWSDVLIIVPWVLYQQTGDTEILAESWEALVHYMDYLKAHERAADQAPASGNQNYGDWLSFQGTSIEVMNDYYYGYMNQLMAKIADILGNEAKADAYSRKYEAVKQKFLQTHVEFTNGNLTIKSKEGNVGLQFQSNTDKKGIWENNSQTSLLWMLKLGFYNSEEMKQAAEELLIQNIRNENPSADSVRAKYGRNTLAVGFLGSNVITPVLTEIGHGDVSYDLLLQEDQPSWLFEVLAGATTIWERWNSYTPGVGFGDSEMNSFNHYAYGSVVEWMYRYMAGISADEQNPGFKHIILQPTPDLGEAYNNQKRINSVDSSYESYYGRINVSWKTEDQKFVSYQAEIPANTTAALYLPISEDAAEGAKTAQGVDYQGMELHNGLNCAKFLLLSGGYEFNLRDGKLEITYKAGYQDGEGENPGGDSDITPNDPSKPVKVSSITVKPDAEKIDETGSTVVRAEILPANASNQQVTWLSSDPSIADVDEKGTVTARKAGTVTITATAADGSKTQGSCVITVEKAKETGGDGNQSKPFVRVTGIRVKAAAERIFVNESTTVQANVTPSNASRPDISWSSSNPEIATVEANGTITAKKAGTVTITAAAEDGSGIRGACTITVVKPVVRLNAKKTKLQVRKSTTALKASGLQKGDRIKEWKSSNKRVAAVTKKGKITAKKTGTAKITVTTVKGASASCTFRIVKGKVTTTKLKADVKKLTLKKRQKYQLQIARTPITATEKIRYTSSNAKVAAVTKSGKITAKKSGKATITIRSSNKKSTKVSVTVK